MHKTPGMLLIEEKRGQPIEVLLPSLINQLGATGAAANLNIARGTLYGWLEHLGLEVRKQAVQKETK